MGNDISGGKVTPTLEVLYTPPRVDDIKTSLTELELYPACAVTRASVDSVLLPAFSGEPVRENETEAPLVPSPAPPVEPSGPIALPRPLQIAYHCHR